MSTDGELAALAHVQRYAVFNRSCGHVLGLHQDRAAFTPFIAQMQALGRHSLRTRLSTVADVEAVLRGDRCERCEPYWAAGDQS